MTNKSLLQTVNYICIFYAKIHIRQSQAVTIMTMINKKITKTEKCKNIRKIIDCGIIYEQYDLLMILMYIYITIL